MVTTANRQAYLNAFKRMVEIADRNHLYLPFQKDSRLRAKYFPGAGQHIARTKLIEAYTREFAEQTPDEKMLQHALWPWIHGYDASLTHILDDLKNHQDNAPQTLPTERQRALEKKFTRVGAEEIATFWTVYAAGNTDYRKTIIDMLADIKPPEVTPTPPPTMSSRPNRPPSPEDTPLSTEPDPATQSAYALFGALIFFIPALILVGVQFWRYPNDSHWIVISIATLLGLITLLFLVDFLRKRNQ